MSVIVLAGMIGAGKTTYTQKIAEILGTTAFYEQVDDNPILDVYYTDPEKYAFALQIFFLNSRFRSIKAALTHKHNVLDRSIYEDALFTKVNVINGNISEVEHQIYLELLDNMMEELEGMPKKAPDLLVYLSGPFDHILNNIQKRGRSYEQIEGNRSLLEYYQQLHDMYDDWYEEYNYSEKIKIDISQYNILNNPEDWDAVYNIINRHLPKEN